VKSHNLTALAVGATAAIGVLALLSVLRADSLRRRTLGGSDAVQGARSQIERWDGEGGQILPEGPDDEQDA
jgi:hypothetical protein